MSSLITDLHTLHNTLSRYVNTGCLTSRDKYLSLFSTQTPFRLNADKVLKLYNQARDSMNDSSHEKQVFSIPVYSGDNRFVHRMMEYLDKNLRNYLHAAYIHGSLGTHDEIAYSDFDAVVILSENAFQSRNDLQRAAILLHRARRIMSQHDPLQHHGWFTLTSISLNAYPCSYFPVELFAFAKSLLHDKGTELSIRVQQNNHEYKNSFNNLAEGLVNTLTSGVRPRNMFQLKSLLSEFMLLPACYVQARDGAGIYKKYSFDSARNDFTKEQWSIMDEASSIRSNWHYRIGYARKTLITRNSIVGRIAAQHYSPRISRNNKNILTEDFYRRMRTLAIAMLEKLAGLEDRPGRFG